MQLLPSSLAPPSDGKTCRLGHFRTDQDARHPRLTYVSRETGRFHPAKLADEANILVIRTTETLQMYDIWADRYQV
jgi:hypothetical protein